MEKSVFVISDGECEDLGDLCDFEMEPISSQELIDPLEFIKQDAIKNTAPETEPEPVYHEYELIEIDDSSQEQPDEEDVEDLGDLEDHFPNQATSPVDDSGQSYSEATSNNTNSTIPDYSQLTIKELQVNLFYANKKGGGELMLFSLKVSISRYGFKNLKSREQMVSILESIRASENLQTPQVTATDNNNEERRMIIQHIKSQENVWKKILRYETVDVDQVYHGLTCKKSKVKAVLDEFVSYKYIYIYFYFYFLNVKYRLH
jgi:hypothetical protein